MSSCLYTAQGRITCSADDRPSTNFIIEHFAKPSSSNNTPRAPKQQQCGSVNVTEPITTGNYQPVCNRWCKNHGYESYAGGDNWSYRYEPETRRHYGKCGCCKRG